MGDLKKGPTINNIRWQNYNEQIDVPDQYNSKKKSTRFGLSKYKK